MDPKSEEELLDPDLDAIGRETGGRNLNTEESDVSGIALDLNGLSAPANVDVSGRCARCFQAESDAAGGAEDVGGCIPPGE